MAKSVFGTSRLDVTVPLPFVPPEILTTNCKTNVVIMYSAIEADKTSRVDTCPSLLSDTVQASQVRTVSYSIQTHNWLKKCHTFDLFLQVLQDTMSIAAIREHRRARCT
jgi:hypothetical protein